MTHSLFRSLTLILLLLAAATPAQAQPADLSFFDTRDITICPASMADPSPPSFSAEMCKKGVAGDDRLISCVSVREPPQGVQLPWSPNPPFRYHEPHKKCVYAVFGSFAGGGSRHLNPWGCSRSETPLITGAAEDQAYSLLQTSDALVGQEKHVVGMVGVLARHYHSAALAQLLMCQDTNKTQLLPFA